MEPIINSYNTGFISKKDYTIRLKQGLEPQTFGNLIGYPCNNAIKYPINLPNVNYNTDYAKDRYPAILPI